MTIHQYFGPERRDPASRNRRAMLEKVWAIWITGVLQPSLPQDILLDLGLAEQPAMVTRALDLYVQRPDLADQVQVPGTRLIDVFDRLDRALLILGAPGAGKTTLLLTLARDLLIRAAQDPEQPLPVVFPLSSWAQRRRPLADWLVDALSEQYDVSRKIGQAWVDAHQILPLLDGLDEVQAEARAACVQAINTFRQEHGLLPLVVCSRVADYEALGTRLRLQGALVVQPLTHAQVESYLTQVGQPLAAVREAFGDNPTLWELLDTPFMLTIVTLTYAGEPIGAFHASGTPEAQRRALFAAYVDRMFQRWGARTRYTRQQTEHWLAWLAWQMAQHSQTVFSLERMQPDWLPPRQRWVPTHGTRLVAGLGAGLVWGLVCVLVVGLALGLDYGLGAGLFAGPLGALIGALTGYSVEITSIEMVRWSGLRFLSELLLPSGRRLRAGLIFGLGAGLGLGLFGGLSAGLDGGLGAGLFAGLGVGLDGALVAALVAGLGVALGVVLITGLVAALNAPLFFGLVFELGDPLNFGPGIGLICGLVYKLYAGLAAGLSSGEIATKAIPNEGIHRSARMALVSGLLAGLGAGLGLGLGFGLVGGLRVGLLAGLGAGLGLGLATGIRYGGRACLQHLLLRLGLWYQGFAPWQYVDFLDEAAKRLFLRKIGGGYSFVHRRLQDYFAARYTELGDAVKPDASG